MALFLDQSFELVKKISLETESDFILNKNTVHYSGEFKYLLNNYMLFLITLVLCHKKRIV